MSHLGPIFSPFSRFLFHKFPLFVHKMTPYTSRNLSFKLIICTFVCFLFPTLILTELLDSSSSNSCFCQLEGQIDDCSCNIDTVDHYNNVRLYPRLNSLLNKNYFRFFKVNLKRPCPFWEDDGRCTIRDCSVKPCSEEQLPEGLKTSHRKHEHHNKYSKEAQNGGNDQDCEQERKLGHLDTAISDENREDFVRWKEHDDAQHHFCQMEDETSADLQHVDLLLNPERYTGYKGESAWRIWKSIYEENCFKPHPGYGQYLDSNSVRGMCLEKRVFYRAVSGLHTSINVHLTAHYLMDDKTGFGVASWGRNIQEFQHRFDPELTKGEGPMRLRNLYFLYLLELRALSKAAPFLTNENFYTGNEEEDDEVRHAVSELLNVIKAFPDHFNESTMFTGDRKQAELLKEEFRLHFVNISRIMDCVGCDKCRLWGKLQIQGLGTALKILFSGELSGAEFNLNAMKRSKFQLTRTEIVTLFNAFGRLSNSIYELETFRKMSNR